MSSPNKFLISVKIKFFQNLNSAEESKHNRDHGDKSLPNQFLISVKIKVSQNLNFAEEIKQSWSRWHEFVEAQK